MDENKILSTPKNNYKKIIKDLVDKTTFQYFLNIKEGHTKLNETLYTDCVMQLYLTPKLLTTSEKKLLDLLMS